MNIDLSDIQTQSLLARGKKMNKKLLVAIGAGLCVASSYGFSEQAIDSTTIERISTNSSGKIYISLDKGVSSVCGQSSTFLLPNREGKMNSLYYRALSAYTKGEKISIQGTGQCSGEHEFISSISAVIET